MFNSVQIHFNEFFKFRQKHMRRLVLQKTIKIGIACEKKVLIQKIAKQVSDLKSFIQRNILRIQKTGLGEYRRLD